MSDRPWSKWFWADWEADEGLRVCSFAAQGLWMRMLCICAKAEPRGYLTINGKPLDLEGLSIAVGHLPSEVGPLVDELDRWGVFSRNRHGTIYSRRIIKDEKRSKEGRKHIKKRWSQGDENEEENSVPNRSPTRGPTTHMPESRGKSNSVSNETGVNADPSRVLFQQGLRFMVNAGVKESQARAIIGKWRKEHSDEGILVALGKAQREGALDPVGFVEGVFRAEKNKPKQQSSLVDQIKREKGLI